MKRILVCLTLVSFLAVAQVSPEAVGILDAVPLESVIQVRGARPSM